jgi:parafibromin
VAEQLCTRRVDLLLPSAFQPLEPHFHLPSSPVEDPTTARGKQICMLEQPFKYRNFLAVFHAIMCR